MILVSLIILPRRLLFIFITPNDDPNKTRPLFSRNNAFTTDLRRPPYSVLFSACLPSLCPVPLLFQNRLGCSKMRSCLEICTELVFAQRPRGQTCTLTIAWRQITMRRPGRGPEIRTKRWYLAFPFLALSLSFLSFHSSLSLSIFLHSLLYGYTGMPTPVTW